MSETIMRTGLDGSGYVDGARVITKANLDIIDSANKAHGALLALEGRFGGIGSRANTGFGAARAAVESMHKSFAGLKSMVEQVESRIIRIGATVLVFQALGSAVNAVSRFFISGIKNVQEYNDILIAMSASLTQIAIMNNKKDKTDKSLPQMYAESARYAGVLAEKMREVDINSSANYDQIMSMLQVYTATGRVLDVNNSTQMAGFTALSNAIPAMTKGQDITKQMTTEMRAFATGTLTAGSTIAKMVDSMAKADGVKGGLKELIKIGNESGRSVLEVAAKYLEGFTAAIPAIATTLTTAKTSFETALGVAQRKVFAPIVSDLVKIIQGAIKEVGDGTNTIASMVQGAWAGVRDTLFDVATITSKAGKISEILVIKPEVMEGLKTFGNALKWVGIILRELVVGVTAHIGGITTLLVAYGLRKAIIGANNIATQLFTKTIAENTVATEVLVLTTEQLAAAETKAWAAVGARMTRDAESIAAQITKNRTKQNALNLAVLEAQSQTEKYALERRIIASDIESNLVSRKTIELGIAKIEMRAASKLALNEEAIANVRLLESEAMVAGARRANIASQLANVTKKIDNYGPAGTSVATSQIYAELLQKQAYLQNQYSVATGEAITKTMMMKEAQALEIITTKQLAGARQQLLYAQIALNKIEQQGIGLTSDKARALNDLKVAQTTVIQAMGAQQLSAATLAAERYNAALAKQGILTSEVTGASIVQSRILYEKALLNDKLTGSTLANVIVSRAQTEATIINTAMTRIQNVTIGLMNTGMTLSAFSVAKLTVQQGLATVATAALTVATNVLNTALSLIGGTLGVVLIALYTGYKAWSNYGSAAEEAIKKASGIAKTNKEIVDGIKEEIKTRELAISTAKKAEESAKSGIKPKYDPEEANYIKFGSDYNKFTKMRSDIKAMEDTYTLMKSGGPVPKEQLGGKYAQFWDNVTGKYVISETQFKSMRLEINEATKSLSEFERIADTGKLKTIVPKGMKPPDLDKGKKSDAQRGLEQLENIQHKWNVEAERSVKFQDELASKQAVLLENYDNDTKAIGNNIKATEKAKQAAYDLLSVKYDVIHAANIAADTKKGQDALDKAIGQAKLQELRSNLALEKSALEEQLADNLITHATYTEKIKANITSETDLYLSSIEKEIYAKEAEQRLVVEGSGKYLSIQADLTKLYSEYLEKYIAGGVLINKVNRDETKDIEAKRKALVELQNSATDAQLALASSRASRVGTSSATGAITDPVANTTAIATADYNKTIELIKREQDAITQKILTEKLGDEELMALQQHRWAITQGIGEAEIALNQKIALSKLTENQKAYDSLAAMASKTFPKIQGFEKLAAMAGRTYAQEKVKVVKDGYESMEDSGKLSALGQKHLISDVAGFGATMFQGLADSQDQSSRKGFESAKAYSMAAAVMSTAQAVINALATSGPPWVGIAMAAAVAAMGAVQIAKISSTSFGGGGGSVSAPSGSFTSAGGGATGAGAGALVSAPYQSIKDSQSAADLDRIANSMDNAALAIGKAAENFLIISEQMKESIPQMLAKIAPGKYTATDPLQSFASQVWQSTGLNHTISGIFASFKLDFKKSFQDLGKSFQDIANAIMGGKWQTTEAGFTMGLSEGELGVGGYQKKEKTGGFFGKDKTAYEPIPVDPAFAEGWKNFLSSIKTQMLTGITAFGMSAEDTQKLMGTAKTPETRIATSGRKDEDILKDIETQITLAADAMANMIPGLKDFQLGGETMSATLGRLSTAMLDVTDGLALVGARLIPTTGAVSDAAYQLQELMGGAEKFTESINTYFKAMFSEGRQEFFETAQATRQVSAAFKEMAPALNKLNLQVPTTRAEFIRLVSAQDLTSESGAALFASLMQVAEGFGKVQDAKEAQDKAYRELPLRKLQATGNEELAGVLKLINDQTIEYIDWMDKGYDLVELKIVQELEYQQAVKKMTETLTSGSKALTDAANKAKTNLDTVVTAQISILGTLKSLLGGNLSTLSPKAQYDQQAAAFKAQGARAKLGDVAAMQGIGQTSQEFLTASRAYNATNATYAADFSLVSETLSQLGGIPSSTDLQTQMIQTQIDKLQEVKQAINDGTLAQNTQLVGILTASATTNVLLSNYLAFQSAITPPVAATPAATSLEGATSAINTAQTAAAAQISTASAGIATQQQAASQPIAPPPPPPAPTFAPTALLWEHDNYSGKNYRAGVGDYLDIKALGDDVLSSIQLAKGAKITIFEHTNFAGASASYSDDIPSLGGWNDKASSFKIEALPGFAMGGITNGPSLAGEGVYREAIIPLPDGRSVRGVMQDNDNKEVVDELKAANAKLIMMEKRLRNIEEKARFVANAGWAVNT